MLGTCSLEYFVQYFHRLCSVFVITLQGLSLVSSSALPGPEALAEGILYLEEHTQEYANTLWIRFKNQHPDLDSPTLTDGMLSDSFTDIDLAEFHLALVRGYYCQNNHIKSAEIVLDLLNHLPDILHRTSRRSSHAAKLVLKICEAQRDLLKVLLQHPSELARLRKESIVRCLLDTMRRLISNVSTEKLKAIACDTVESVTQMLVLSNPRNPRLLSALGASQLDQFDNNPVYGQNMKKLKEAEETFLAAIEAEDGYTAADDSTVPPGLVKEQAWWMEFRRVTELLRAEAQAKASKEETTPIKKSVAPVTTSTEKKRPMAPSKPTVERSRPIAGKPAPNTRGRGSKVSGSLAR